MSKNKINLSFLKYVLIFFLLLIVSLFFTPFGNDEIWNYGFSNNIYKGLVVYKDFNMVITPLYPFIMSLPYHLFTSNILVMDIFNTIIIVIGLFLLDKMFPKRNIAYLFFLIPILFPSYNIFLFILLVLLIYLEKNYNNDYLIGFIIGMLFLTKQHVGLVIFLVSFIYNFKNYKKNLKRIIGFLIPTVIFLIYLISNNALYDFIDQCFLGLFEFGNKNFKFSIFPILVFLFILIFTCITIQKGKKSIENFYILAFYSIAIPLIEPYHLQVSLLSFCMFIMLNYNIDIKYYKYLNMFFYTCTAAYILISICNLSKPVIYPNSINHFEYRAIPKKNIDISKKLTDYMKKSNKKIRVIGNDAYYFKIITDNRVDKLDLINYGNSGYNQTKKLIKELENNKDCLVMISIEDISEGKQTNKEIINYIIKNGNKVDSIYFYDIYSFK